MLSANVNVDLADLSCPKQNVDFLRDPFERDAGYGIYIRDTTCPPKPVSDSRVAAPQ